MNLKVSNYITFLILQVSSCFVHLHNSQRITILMLSCLCNFASFGLIYCIRSNLIWCHVFFSTSAAFDMLPCFNNVRLNVIAYNDPVLGNCSRVILLSDILCITAYFADNFLSSLRCVFFHISEFHNYSIIFAKRR